eukprot:4131118-Pleurochrysis_carterae.AAC.3
MPYLADVPAGCSRTHKCTANLVQARPPEAASGSQGLRRTPSLRRRSSRSRKRVRCCAAGRAAGRRRVRVRVPGDVGVAAPAML